jgi:hypothetical protein
VDLKHDGIVLDHLVDALAPQGILGGGFSRRCAQRALKGDKVDSRKRATRRRPP